MTIENVVMIGYRELLQIVVPGLIFAACPSRSLPSDGEMVMLTSEETMLVRTGERGEVAVG